MSYFDLYLTFDLAVMTLTFNNLSGLYLGHWRLADGCCCGCWSVRADIDMSVVIGEQFMK